MLYKHGRGVPQNYVAAVTWYRQAAEQGEPRGQAFLGGMYAEGHGVPQDVMQAHVWLNLAASRLPPGEMRDLVVKLRNHVTIAMTPAQIAEAQRLASEWTPPSP
jgi:uncharacterized protein